MTDFAPPLVDEPTPVDEALESFASSLRSGLLDTRLPQLFSLISERADFNSMGRHWRVVWGGYTLDDIDVTLDEAGELQRVLGVNWLMIDPGLAPLTAQAVIALILHRQGQPWGDAKLAAANTSAGKAIEAVTYYLGEPPPLGAPSVTPSTSSPAGTNGHPRKSGAARSAKSRNSSRKAGSTKPTG